MTRKRKWMSSRVEGIGRITRSSSWSPFAEKCTAPSPHHQNKVLFLILSSCVFVLGLRVVLNVCVCLCVCVFFLRILCVICVRHAPQLLFVLKVAPSLQHSSVNSVNSLLHVDCRKYFPVCRLHKFCPSLHSTGIFCRWMYMQYIDCRLPNLAICNPRGHLHVTY